MPERTKEPRKHFQVHTVFFLNCFPKRASSGQIFLFIVVNPHLRLKIICLSPEKLHKIARKTVLTLWTCTTKDKGVNFIT